MLSFYRWRLWNSWYSYLVAKLNLELSVLGLFIIISSKPNQTKTILFHFSSFDGKEWRLRLSQGRENYFNPLYSIKGNQGPMESKNGTVIWLSLTGAGTDSKQLWVSSNISLWIFYCTFLLALLLISSLCICPFVLSDFSSDKNFLSQHSFCLL